MYGYSFQPVFELSEPLIEDIPVWRGTPSQDQPYICSQWTDNQIDYHVRVTYTPERTLALYRWDDLKTHWIELPFPQEWRIALDAWASHVLNLPPTL